MPAPFAAVGPLILGVSLIQLANGYAGSLIGIRLADAQVEPVVAGIIAAAYFAGYATAPSSVTGSHQPAGHIRPLPGHCTSTPSCEVLRGSTTATSWHCFSCKIAAISPM
jgi:hypothetical protein